MASSIGQTAYANPTQSQVEFPQKLMSGSTSGIGGQSTESHGRYAPGGHFQYTPGSNRYNVPCKYNIIEAEGTWGSTVLSKYNPVKQIGGHAGYLNQKPISRLNKTDMVAMNIGRTAVEPFLPRGGNVMRVVGTDNSEEPIAFDTRTFKDENPPNIAFGCRRASALPSDKNENTSADDTVQKYVG